MKPLDWISEDEFFLEGVRFLCAPGNYSLKTSADRFVLLKDRDILERYAEEFGRSDVQNVLEFGIFQGGSPALFTLWFDLKKFVGIDVSAPVPAFDRFSSGPKANGRICTYYGVSQSDAPRITGIVEKEFQGAPIDLIIDDASHCYSLSRRSFELAFPLLKPGGHYVIEDWAWAHWPTIDLYEGQTALTKLIFEITMLCASRKDLIAEIRILPWFVAIRKAENAPTMSGFKIDELIHKRGIEIAGPRDLNLGGMAKLLLSRVRHK